MKVNAAGIKALFADDVEFRKTTIRNFVMDQTNSYEDRLDVYLNTPHHLQHEDSWLFHHPTIEDDDWMDYNNYNRYETIGLVDMPEYHEWNEQKIREWYLGCMNNGVWSFQYDW